MTNLREAHTHTYTKGMPDSRHRIRITVLFYYSASAPLLTLSLPYCSLTLVLSLCVKVEEIIMTATKIERQKNTAAGICWAYYDKKVWSLTVGVDWPWNARNDCSNCVVDSFYSLWHLSRAVCRYSQNYIVLKMNLMSFIGYESGSNFVTGWPYTHTMVSVE